jgi:hypothetical protein
MTVRLRLALTIVLAGLATAIGVIVTLAVAFQRFDHESAYQRADGFISRVMPCTATCWTSTSANRRSSRLPAQPAAVRPRQPALPAGAGRHRAGAQRQGVAAAAGTTAWRWNRCARRPRLRPAATADAPPT